MEKHTHADAVDLGATNVRTALIRRDGTIDSYRTEPVKDEDGISVTDQIFSMLSSMQDETEIMPEAAGISTAGPVDRKAGSVVRSPNMRCRNILLRDPMEHFLGVPVTMLTDCKAGVLGEYVYGGADSANTVVYLTFSTGIGAGIISDGHLLSCAGGNAGEVGHLFVDSQYRLPCGCGGYDHLEDTAGIE
jgi:glucokinase